MLITLEISTPCFTYETPPLRLQGHFCRCSVWNEVQMLRLVPELPEGVYTPDTNWHFFPNWVDESPWLHFNGNSFAQFRTNANSSPVWSLCCWWLAIIRSIFSWSRRDVTPNVHSVKMITRASTKYANTQCKKFTPKTTQQRCNSDPILPWCKCT